MFQRTECLFSVVSWDIIGDNVLNLYRDNTNISVHSSCSGKKVGTRTIAYNSRARGMVRVASEMVRIFDTISDNQHKDNTMPKVRGKCMQLMIKLGWYDSINLL